MRDGAARDGGAAGAEVRANQPQEPKSPETGVALAATPCTQVLQPHARQCCNPTCLTGCNPTPPRPQTPRPPPPRPPPPVPQAWAHPEGEEWSVFYAHPATAQLDAVRDP